MICLLVRIVCVLRPLSRLVVALRRDVVVTLLALPALRRRRGWGRVSGRQRCMVVGRVLVHLLLGVRIRCRGFSCAVRGLLAPSAQA